jgi:hypothetical protein
MVFACSRGVKQAPARDPREGRRETRGRDLTRIRELLDCVDVGQREREAFIDMQSWLLQREHAQLSEKQRKWVDSRHAELLLGDPAERNANVPRGKEVQQPPVLSKLPKAPPGRRQEQRAAEPAPEPDYPIPDDNDLPDWF